MPAWSHPYMRSHRFSFIAGWTAVALMAVAGFAAFGNPNATTEEIQAEAAEASIGHMSGAYAGLAFAYLGIDAGTEEPLINAIDVLAAEVAAFPVGSPDDLAQDGKSSGSLNSATGWLSEVEVRALVSLYFSARDVNQAVRVAWCESRFDPDSVNLRTGGVGLFQHLPKYWDERAEAAGFTGAEPTDPEASVAAAAWAVYQGGGWDVFACRD